MFDTYVTIVGNVLTAPEWRRTTQSNTLVANFKVASTARRLDRDSGRWVDGNSLRVRVNCWRKLAEGVAASVMVGDPVVVCGRLYTRDWTDEAGNHRTLYELEAVAVGHDLSRGRGRFLRNRPSLSTSAVSDAEAEQRVHGEPTEPVPDSEAPARPDLGGLDDEFELPDLGSDEYAASPGTRPGSGAYRQVGGDEPFPSDPFDGAEPAETSDELAPLAAEAVGSNAGGSDVGGSDAGGSAAGRFEGGEAAVESLGRPEESGAGAEVTGRGRRGRGRQPQPV
ncbi:single-stranded DNA-binding protein [Verrucosispora sp. FIM060022]|uniref:single-stranded DNA-binding protein n=1 Tax=Verrucosispora sp. FIM060022 TaxID=1479020 RepID=UPI000F88E286|nr:single-stranded DNA-binding protein [Verrucosispora sp. FIM060022]RUL90396.1 single-stranded DNA-binding protein [Verrucosispora sp. FIM060022]